MYALYEPRYYIDVSVLTGMINKVKTVTLSRRKIEKERKSQ